MEIGLIGDNGHLVQNHVVGDRGEGFENVIIHQLQMEEQNVQEMEHTLKHAIQELVLCQVPIYRNKISINQGGGHFDPGHWKNDFFLLKELSYSVNFFSSWR